MPRIRAVRAEPLDIELTEPFGIASGAQLVAQNVLVRVELDDGTLGLGEAAPFPAVNGETQAMALDAVNALADELVGEDALRTRRLAEICREAVPSARCALETASLDAFCRVTCQSLWQHFGAAEVALETDITIPTGSPEHAGASAKRASADGFRTLKIKVGGTALEHDVARIRAAAAAAPTARLVLDANGAFGAEQALELLERVADVPIALFEQPTPRDDLEGMRRVRERCKPPVAADESVRSAADVVRVAAERAADVVNVKLTKCGIAEALDIVATARAHGLGLMIGGMVESVLAMTTSGCLAAGLGGFTFIDLDTPLFMRNAPLSGGFLRQGSQLRFDTLKAGHGVALGAGGLLTRSGRA